MKLADAPRAVRRELTRRRTLPFTRYPDQPEAGELWFGGEDEFGLILVCAICGCDGNVSRIVRDHCHITGLLRGLLCQHHNLEEARQSSPLWEYWQTNAPLLAKRELYATPRHLTQDEVLTLPIAELFALAAEREALVMS